MTNKEIIEDFDLNNDGIITEEEINKVHLMETFTNANEKSDAQKKMAWFALIGMLIYPFCVILAVVFGLDVAATVLGGMAATYFGSVAIIVAAFFGAEAYSSKKRI